MTEENEEATDPTAALAVPDVADGTPADVTTLSKADLVAWLKGEDITEDDDTDEIMYEQAVRILSATDSDAVLKDDDVRKAATLVGTTFVIRSASWRKSTKSEDGNGRYAFMGCVDENGEPFYTSCGATKVVLQVRKAQLEGWLPWQVTLESIDTNSGRTMLQLAAPEKPF